MRTRSTDLAASSRNVRPRVRSGAFTPPPSILPLILAFLALFGLGGCATGGGGSDLPNSLEGTIYAGTNPVPGARIELRPSGWKPGGAPAGSVFWADEKGKFQIAQPMGGNWKLVAWDSTGGLACQTELQLDRSAPVDMYLEPVGASSGVIGDSLDIADGFDVYALGIDRRSKLDTNGNWRLDSVPAGNLDLVAVSRTDPAVFYPLGRIFVGSGDSSVAPPASIGSNPDTNRIAHGRLWLPIGRPARNGFVVLRSGSDSIRAAVDDSGRFVLRLPLEGSWKLEAKSQTRVRFDSLDRTDLSPNGLPATKRRLERIDLFLTGTVYGSLLPGIGWISTGGSTAGWKAVVSGIPRSETTGIAGHFRIRSVPAGTWTIEATGPDGRKLSYPPARIDPDVENSLPVRVVRSTLDTVPEGSFMPSQVWYGSVPLAGARVVAIPEDPRDSLLRMQGTADDSGRFALQLDTTRRYSLRFQDKDGRSVGNEYPWGSPTVPATVHEFRISP